MANNYYEMNGVLELEHVTPVIRAIFGLLELDENYPGNGQVYFAQIPERTDYCGEAFRESLATLATGLKIQMCEPVPGDRGGGEPKCGEILHAIAKCFGREADEDLQLLAARLDLREDDVPDIGELVQLAKSFNDGHGLKRCILQGAWYCSKPRLFEFGGDAGYYGQAIRIQGSSQDVITMATELENALLRDAVEAAARVLHDHVEVVIAGVVDDRSRDLIRAELGRLVSA